jgi:3-methyl-2-oxobutanoate hydroxymethyltransferase
MAKKITAPSLRDMKAKGEAIVCITAYDFPFARLADESGADLILVGDSLGNVVLGHENTLPVTLEDMEHHTRAVARGVDRALLVADLPFGSYGASVSQAVESSVRLIKAGAEAVKLEGPYLDEVRALVQAGVPVMGHLGMTPQSIHRFGGFRVQGKGDAANAVVEAARELDEAGAFAIVLELIPQDLAAEVTSAISCPTIGIGAGPHCDGQIQVLHDVLGIGTQSFKHAKRYAEMSQVTLQALRSYAEEVRGKSFPAPEHSF